MEIGSSESPLQRPNAGGGRAVLVAYASKGGSTREVAERIAALVRECGHRVEEPREMAHFLAATRPRDYRVFAGVIDAESWPLYGRLFLRMFGGRVGDDRDWPSIVRWARQIAAALGTPARAESAPR